MRERLAELKAIAERAHRGQTDLQGKPYMEHVEAVADGVTSTSAKAVALFHDSIEDGALTVNQLARWLTSDELAAVMLLTRSDSETYSQYVDRVATAPGLAGELAREVKVSDLHHNLSRMLPQLERLRSRYERALALLG